MTELNQMTNEVVVTGTLKHKELAEKVTKKGSTAIMGDIVVEFIDKNNSINSIRVQVYVPKLKRDGTLSKMYESYVTIMNDYKDKDTFGDEADIISVTGEINSNDYINQQGSQVSNNRIRARFMNRLDKGSEYSPEAYATLEAYIDGYIDEMDSNGEPTGRKKVNLYTVGYNQSVNELQNVYVPEELSEAFSQMYYPGSTAPITLAIKHLAETEELDDDQSDELGFGTFKEPTRAITNYTDELWIVGGKLPFEEPQALDQEQINELKKLRKQHLATLDSNVPEKKNGPMTGFGTQPDNQQNSENPFSSDDVKF